MMHPLGSRQARRPLILGILYLAAGSTVVGASGCGNSSQANGTQAAVDPEEARRTNDMAEFYKKNPVGKTKGARSAADKMADFYKKNGQPGR